MTSVAELKQIAKQNNLRGYSHLSREKLIELLKEKNLMPEEKEPKYINLVGIRNNPHDVIIVDITTKEEFKFPSIYKASKFLGKTPRIITYWNGRVYKNQYEIKLGYPPPPNNNKCYPRKTLKATIKKIREYCMNERGFDPMLFI